ncbi:OmpA family protein [Arenimonas sp. MALMAid1274]|uniref:OmpA family protein n=1 Tax=Arenimonas sp. MALMAid1274 TaxID=3411630 RepID=UPI003B9F7FEA
MTVTTALGSREGDYESRKRLAGREGEGWVLLYLASVPDGKGATRTMASERYVHDADLAAARTYRTAFEEDVQEDYPGTTALGVSSAVLAELHAAGKARFALVGESSWVLPSLSGAAGGALPGSDLLASLTRNNSVSFKGELVCRGSARFSVLVNGRRQSLAALVATGQFTARDGKVMQAELTVLDDPTNPLALQWRIGESALRVVRLDFPVPEASQSMAAQLRAEKRLVLPGLYFDFGSAVLRPESASQLPDIVALILSVPGVPLVIEGHTDSVGADAANLKLSQARADAVRAALVKLDAALAPRLSSQGHGETRPKADNSTLEGRALNRRVELAMP